MIHQKMCVCFLHSGTTQWMQVRVLSHASPKLWIYSSCCYSDSTEELPGGRDFIKLMKEKVAEYDPCYIIKIVQSPIMYSYHSSRTLEMKGTNPPMFAPQCE